MKTRRKQFTDIIMAEHVALIGFPQIIVTRAFHYSFLKAQGWSTRARGFSSLDYIVFGRPPVDAPLTDEAFRDTLLKEAAPLFAPQGYTMRPLRRVA